MAKNHEIFTSIQRKNWAEVFTLLQQEPGVVGDYYVSNSGKVSVLQAALNCLSRTQENRPEVLKIIIDSLMSLKLGPQNEILHPAVNSPLVLILNNYKNKPWAGEIVEYLTQYDILPNLAELTQLIEKLPNDGKECLATISLLKKFGKSFELNKENLELFSIKLANLPQNISNEILENFSTILSDQSRLELEQIFSYSDPDNPILIEKKLSNMIKNGKFSEAMEVIKDVSNRNISYKVHTNLEPDNLHALLKLCDFGLNAIVNDIVKNINGNYTYENTSCLNISDLSALKLCIIR